MQIHLDSFYKMLFLFLHIEKIYFILKIKFIQFLNTNSKFMLKKYLSK